MHRFVYMYASSNVLCLYKARRKLGRNGSKYLRKMLIWNIKVHFCQYFFFLRLIDQLIWLFYLLFYFRHIFIMKYANYSNAIRILLYWLYKNVYRYKFRWVMRTRLRLVTQFSSNELTNETNSSCDCCQFVVVSKWLHRTIALVIVVSLLYQSDYIEEF